MVNSKLEIIESNEAFIRMFLPDMQDVFTNREEGLKGASLDRIISFAKLFEAAFLHETKLHKEKFQYEGKLYDIDIFVVERNSAEGGINNRRY